MAPAISQRGSRVFLRVFPLAVSACLIACAGPADGVAALQSSTPPQGALAATYRGDATFYDATGGGACGDNPVSDLHVAALAEPSWNGAAFCGACAEVTGPKGRTFVRIVDRCPECLDASLDMGKPAFAELDKLDVGRLPITWKLANCPVQGPLSYFLVAGSSQYWLGLRVRNHKVPVARVEIEVGGTFVALERKPWNDFVIEGGPKTESSFRVRVTSWNGEALTDTLPGPRSSVTFQGAKNFAPM